jgi:phage baseplate assembly protein W
MSARYRGWRFQVPPIDVPGAEAGLGWDPAGAIDTVADDAAIRQSLMLLISTRPGERVMRPEYGCDLDQLVFSPNDDTTAGLAIHFVRQAVERWEPRVEILRVDAGRDPDPENDMLLQIVLDYRVRATLQTHQLMVTTDLERGRP